MFTIFSDITPINIDIDELFLNTYIITAIVIGIIALFGVMVWRVYKGSEITFWGISLKPDARVKALQENNDKLSLKFAELNSITIQKNNILKLLNMLCKELNALFIVENEQFDQKIEMIYKFMLPGIASIVTNDRENVLRVAILIPDPKNSANLKMLTGYGYSVGGQTNLRLDINNSFAGSAYRCQEIYHCDDLTKNKTWKAHPKATKTYLSLACLPICSEGKIYGILNIDGEKPNSFCSDDIDYLSYFADILGSLFRLMDVRKDMNALTQTNISLMKEIQQLKEDQDIEEEVKLYKPNNKKGEVAL